MQSPVKLFVIPADRVPAGPPDPPRELHVDAPTMDLLRETARALVAAEGCRVRAVSCGSDGLLVYAEERP